MDVRMITSKKLVMEVETFNNIQAGYLKRLTIAISAMNTELIDFYTRELHIANKMQRHTLNQIVYGDMGEMAHVEG